ncbi:hypothetical protein [Actinomadura atramentaria]|uniref:hypothetical protein n=1 Tax=Actinomadura atramentaria TaxID=1990 RepID=UPI0012FB3C47|nr:hypothetical protein [Actinomadura atramentaria]
MSTTKPKPGDAVTFAVEYGEGLGRVPAGTKGTVRAVYPPGTPGIGHNGTDDTVVIDIKRPIGPDRAVAMSLPTFSEVCTTGSAKSKGGK